MAFASIVLRTSISRLSLRLGGASRSGQSEPRISLSARVSFSHPHSITSEHKKLTWNGRIAHRVAKTEERGLQTRGVPPTLDSLESYIRKGLPRPSLPATMGKYNFTALRVRQTALQQHAAGKIRAPPKWLDVVADIPPAQVLVRNQPPQHQLVRQRVKTLPGASKPQVVFEVQEKRMKPKKASRMFLPTEIKYEEDQLRHEFFRDHPWELARPRVLVESTGKESEHYDWSRLQQPGKRLDGESVVQRQLWLLNNVPDMTKSAAYDIARREFYRLRLQEDIERRVAAEEAEATGATFGPSLLEVGMELENQEYERWKAWAKTEAQLLDQRTAAFTGAPEIAARDEAVEELEEKVPLPV